MIHHSVYSNETQLSKPKKTNRTLSALVPYLPNTSWHQHQARIDYTATTIHLARLVCRIIGTWIDKSGEGSWRSNLQKSATGDMIGTINRIKKKGTFCVPKVVVDQDVDSGTKLKGYLYDIPLSI